MRFLAPLLAAALALTGCAYKPDGSVDFSGSVAKDTAWIRKTAPIVGKALIQINGAIVAVECQDAQTGAIIAGKLAKVISGNGTAKVTALQKDVDAVYQALQTNAQLAEVLCPYFVAVQSNVQVGSVPAGAPSQVINLPPS